MTQVPASSHGGPAFNGGTITSALDVSVAGDSDIRLPDGTGELSVTPKVGSGVNGQVTVYNETFTQFSALNASSGLSVVTTGGGVTVTSASASADVLALGNGAGYYLRAGPLRGLIIGLVHAAPADGALAAGECALWFDQTNAAAKLMLKGKTADGTVVTAAIALA